jgi:hypothetical protein
VADNAAAAPHLHDNVDGVGGYPHTSEADDMGVVEQLVVEQLTGDVAIAAREHSTHCLPGMSSSKAYAHLTAVKRQEGQRKVTTAANTACLMQNRECGSVLIKQKRRVRCCTP